MAGACGQVTHEDKLLPQLCVTAKKNKDVKFGYISLVRPVLEYACKLWHAGLTEAPVGYVTVHSAKRTKNSIPIPGYEEALVPARLQSLYQCRQELCMRFFNSAQDPTHKATPLIAPS